MPSDNTVVAEFQFRASDFLHQFTEGLKKSSLPIVDSIPGPGNATLWVDHVEFLQASLRRDTDQTYRIEVEDWQMRLDADGRPTIPVDGKRFQIAQPVKVALAEAAALEGGNLAGAGQLFEVQLTLIISLRLVSSQNQFALLTTLDYLEGVPVAYTAAASRLTNILAPKIGGTVPLPLGVMGGMNPSRTPNAVITVSQDLQRVACRFTQKNWATVMEPSWRTFLSGQISDDLGTHSWSSATKPESLLFDRFFYQAEQKAAQDPDAIIRFSLQGGVDQSWTNIPNGVRFAARAFYNIYDACPWDMRMTVFARIDLVPKPDILYFNISFEAGPSNFASSVCIELSSILWAIAGAGLLEKGKIDFGEWAGGILWPLYAWEVIWDLIHRGISQGIDPNKIAGATCTKKSQTELECQRPMSGLREIRMLSDYLVFQGDTSTPTLSRATLTVSVSEFKYGPPTDAFTCDSDFAATARALRDSADEWLKAWAGIDLGSQGEVPLFIYQATLRDDAWGMFSIRSDPSSKGFHLVVTFAEKATARERRLFFLNPYPCKILIQTSGGVRIITLPAPLAPSAQDVDNLVNGAATLVAARCKALTVPRHRSLKLDLLSDPDPRDVLRLWEIRFLGLEPGGVFQLQGKGGRLMDERVVNRRGVLELFGLSKDDSLLMHQMQAPAVAENPAGRLLNIRHVTLVPQATLSPGFRVERVDIVNTRRGEMLIASGRDQVSLYGVSELSPPKLIANGLLGAGWNWRIDAGDLMFDTVSGTYALDDAFLTIRKKADRKNCPNQKVIVRGGVEYRLTQTGVDIHDGSNCFEQHLHLNGATDFAFVANRLVVATQVGLSIYQITNKGLPLIASTIGLQQPQIVRGPSRLFGERLVVRCRSERTKILDFGSVEEPEIVADFQESPPWLSMSVGTRTVARVGESGTQIDVFAQGVSAAWNGSVGLENCQRSSSG